MDRSLNQLQMHGISNCDTIKKAKTWLNDAGLEFSFRDYKKLPPSTQELQSWAALVGWENLLNKRGTTWRKLPTQTQQSVNEHTVCALLSENPSMIKRPVLVMQDQNNIQVWVGFKADQYATIFNL